MNQGPYQTNKQVELKFERKSKTFQRAEGKFFFQHAVTMSAEQRSDSPLFSGGGASAVSDAAVRQEVAAAFSAAQRLLT